MIAMIASADALLTELGAVLKWISSLRAVENPVRIRSWCEWRIEQEEGLRSKMPTATPPPSRDLPDVSSLVGLARSRIVTALGEPFDGCHVMKDDRWVEQACADLPRVSYPFFHLEGMPGGGDELWLDFNGDDVCVRAVWVGSQ
jgi:hypothetical protein